MKSQMSTQKFNRILELRYGTLRQFSWKQCFIVLAQTQWTQVQRQSLENKGVSPDIPLQVGYRSKKQGLTHMWLHASQ
jgi:C-terminal processing protease CtpA/Prc